ncbi:MAG: hypothetical protein WC884_04280 [Candidatus Paceibacterota bacterium]
MKDEEKVILALGGLALLAWLLSKKRGKCPRCNYPVTEHDPMCPNCGQQLEWRHFK